MQLGCGVFFFSSYNGLIWLSVRVKDGIKWAQELYSVTNGVEGRRDQRLLNCFETLAVVTCSHWDVGTRFSMTHNAWSESYGLEERGNRQGGSQQVDVSAPWLHTSKKRVVYRTDRAARAFSLLWAFRKEHAESWRNMMVIYTFAKQGRRYSTSAFLRKFKFGSLKKSHRGNQHLNLLPCNLSSRKVLFQRYSAIILTIRMSRVFPSIHRWR